jgi:hypothetical protein
MIWLQHNHKLGHEPLHLLHTPWNLLHHFVGAQVIPANICTNYKHNPLICSFPDRSNCQAYVSTQILVAITGLKALSLSRGVYTPKVEGTQHSHKNLGLDRLIPKQKNVSTNASIDRQPFFFLVKMRISRTKA